MPWRVERSDECPDDHPFAVVKEEDGTVEGCHANEEAARRQLAALEASESEGRSRPKVGEVETRQAEVATEGKRIRGIIPFGTESRDMGGWREQISPTALRNTKLDDLVARVDHAGVPIGR